MSYVNDHLNRRLLEDTFDLYNIYKQKEVVELIADNVRVFEEIWHYREAAICAFVARIIAASSDKSASIRTMSKFKHPTTVQWYDRLREMWPAYVVIHWAEFTKAEPSATATVASSSEKSSSPAIQINQAPRSSASVTFLTTTINTSVLTPATTIDDHAADSGSITDYESESGMEGYDLDADWRPDGYGIAEEVNTSSDWYQYHPPMGEASACGKKRLVQSTEMGATNDASAVEGENGGYSDWGAGGWGASYWDATEETVHSDCNDGYNDSWGVAEEGVPSGYKHDYNYNDDWGVADAGVHSNCHENYDYEWGVADDGANSDCNDAYNDDCGWGSGVSQADEW